MSQLVTTQSALAFTNRMVQLQASGSIEGERYLSFSLDRGINALISLAELQGVVEISVADILPIPQMHESLLGIINWRGKATWTIDVANLVGATHWSRREPIPAMGMGMLVKVRRETVGLLIKEIGTIEIYEPQDCLPIDTAMFAKELQPWLRGYFLDAQKNPKVVIDIQHLSTVL